MICPICERISEYPLRGVATCDGCKEKAELERKAFYRDVRYPINYSSGLLYMKKV